MLCWPHPIAHYEGRSFSQVYASVFCSHFAALGLNVSVEDASHHGRVDMAVDFDHELLMGDRP